VHFVVTGTDAGNPFAILGIVISSVAVAGLVFRRIARSRPRPPHLPGAGGPAAPQPVLVRIPEPVGSPGA
jgi:hypothetical protein